MARNYETGIFVDYYFKYDDKPGSKEHWFDYEVPEAICMEAVRNIFSFYSIPISGDTKSNYYVRDKELWNLISRLKAWSTLEDDEEFIEYCKKACEQDAYEAWKDEYEQDNYLGIYAEDEDDEEDLEEKLQETSKKQKYEILVCDGNRAASRGGEPNNFYELTTDDENIEEAIRSVFEKIFDFEYLDYYDEELEDPNFSVFEAVQEMDISGGDPFIVSILENGKQVYSFGEFEDEIFINNKELAIKHFPDYAFDEYLDESLNEAKSVTKEDLINWLHEHEEVALTEEEFDYLVQDLWEAIKHEEAMSDGSYQSIEEVDVGELIDGSDNPTHFLGHKLMGLIDEEDLDESLNESATSKYVIKKVLRNEDEILNYGDGNPVDNKYFDTKEDAENYRNSILHRLGSDNEDGTYFDFIIEESEYVNEAVKTLVPPKRDEKNTYIKKLAKSDFEVGKTFDPDDFNYFRKICLDDGIKVTKQDFERYFEYLEDIRLNESSTTLVSPKRDEKGRFKGIRPEYETTGEFDDYDRAQLSAYKLLKRKQPFAVIYAYSQGKGKIILNPPLVKQSQEEVDQFVNSFKRGKEITRVTVDVMYLSQLDNIEYSLKQRNLIESKLTEDIEVGSNVKISAPEEVWDGLDGTVESIQGDEVTVMVNFKPEEGKKVRQNFNKNNLTLSEGLFDRFKKKVKKVTQEFGYDKNLKMPSNPDLKLNVNYWEACREAAARPNSSKVIWTGTVNKGWVVEYDENEPLDIIAYEDFADDNPRPSNSSSSQFQNQRLLMAEGVNKTVKYGVPTAELAKVKKEAQKANFQIKELGETKGVTEFEVIGDSSKDTSWKSLEDMINNINNHINVVTEDIDEDEGWITAQDLYDQGYFEEGEIEELIFTDEAIIIKTKDGKSGKYDYVGGRLYMLEDKVEEKEEAANSLLHKFAEIMEANGFTKGWDAEVTVDDDDNSYLYFDQGGAIYVTFVSPTDIRFMNKSDDLDEPWKENLKSFDELLRTMSSGWPEFNRNITTDAKVDFGVDDEFSTKNTSGKGKFTTYTKENLGKIRQMMIDDQTAAYDDMSYCFETQREDFDNYEDFEEALKKEISEIADEELQNIKAIHIEDDITRISEYGGLDFWGVKGKSVVELDDGRIFVCDDEDDYSLINVVELVLHREVKPEEFDLNKFFN